MIPGFFRSTNKVTNMAPSNQLIRDMLADGRLLPSGTSPDGRRILNWSRKTPPPAPTKAQVIAQRFAESVKKKLDFDCVADFAKALGRTYIPSSPKV